MGDTEVFTGAHHLRLVVEREEKPPAGSCEDVALTMVGPRSSPDVLVDRTILTGNSPIDLPQLNFSTREQADAFVRDYGYDLSREKDRAEAQELFQEAVQFLHRYLCPAPRECDVALHLPEAVEHCQDPLDLLLWASRDGRVEPLQPWACAVLRVMHAISHANHTIRRQYHPEVKRQILDKYRAHVREEEGQLSLGGVPLVSISYREEKSRDSLILKLLHKPDNLPQSVYDRVGVRLVTPTRCSALQAVRYIRTHLLANFAHITPGRSRNNLVELPLHELDYEDEGGLPQAATNPHTSSDFRSIQFTCHQLIKVPNPAYRMAQEMRRKLAEHPCPHLEGALRELESHVREEQIRFFFPYEVQILDLENHQKTEAGDSSHANYRLRQLRAVRSRILGRLLKVRENHIASARIKCHPADLHWRQGKG